jgi:glycerol-3-phosphate dehydrogenase subunit B
MFERVVVVGAGIAGLGAVVAAMPRGAEVRLLDPSLGASALAGGAVDDLPWEQLERAGELLGTIPVAAALEPEIEAFLQAFGLWELAKPGAPLCRLATEAGRIRSARGRDRALLDLGALPDGARVVLPRVARPEWDADALGPALSAERYAREHDLRFDAVEAKILRFVGEERVASAELASRHDEPARLGWLGDRLRETLTLERQQGRRVDALLLGPWLGSDAPRAAALGEALGMAVGEILSGVGSAPGQRFEAARDRLLGALGVQREPRRALAVRAVDAVLEVETDGGAPPIVTDRVVLALGGLAGGGIRYAPPELDAGADEPVAARVPFQLSLEAPVGLAAFGRRLDIVASVNGPTLDEQAWPTDADPSLLEAVGVACHGSMAAERIYAAGDVVADRPRTRLAALRSGLLAGAAAAGEPGAIR